MCGPIADATGQRFAGMPHHLPGVLQSLEPTLNRFGYAALRCLRQAAQGVSDSRRNRRAPPDRSAAGITENRRGALTMTRHTFAALGQVNP
jgi:hypothetical protein